MSIHKFSFSKPVSVLSMTKRDTVCDYFLIGIIHYLLFQGESISNFKPSASAPDILAVAIQPAPSFSSATSTSDKIASAPSSNSKWSCGTCFVSNDAGSTECACCKTVRPGSKAKSEDNSGKETTSSGKRFLIISLIRFYIFYPFLAYSTPSSSVNVEASKCNLSSNSKWSCGTCFVSNDAAAMECVCCKTARPGSNTKPADVSGIVEKKPSGKRTFPLLITFNGFFFRLELHNLLFVQCA